MVDYPSNAPASIASRQEDEAFRSAAPYTASTYASQPTGSTGSVDYAGTLAADRAMAQPAAAVPASRPLAVANSTPDPVRAAQLATARSTEAVDQARAFLEARSQPGVNITGLQPITALRLASAIGDAEKATGFSGLRTKTYPGLLTSAFRTNAQQADIWERSGHRANFAAAPPGRSQHNTGFAADMADSPIRTFVRANAGDYGLASLGGGKAKSALYERSLGGYKAYDVPHITALAGRSVDSPFIEQPIISDAGATRGTGPTPPLNVGQDAQGNPLADGSVPTPRERPGTYQLPPRLADIGTEREHAQADTLTAADRAAGTGREVSSMGDVRTILAGGVPFEQLPDTWQARLQSEFGADAQTRYDAYRQKVGGGTAAAPLRIGPTYAEGGDATLAAGAPVLPSTGGADVGAASGGPLSPAEADESAGGPSTPRPGSTITVKPGDNLWTIAAGVTGNRNTAARYATDIMRANGIRDPRALQPGQRLVLPGGMEAGNVATPRARPGAPATTRSPDFSIADANTSSSGSRSVAAGAEPSLDMAVMGGTGSAPGSRGAIGSAAHDQFERQATDYARGLLEDTSHQEDYPFQGSGFGRSDPAYAADGFNSSRGPDVSFTAGGGGRSPTQMINRTGIMQGDPGPGFEFDPTGGAAGPSGSNMTSAGRTYPDPAAVAARERQLRMLAAQRQFDYARGLGGS